MTSDVNDATGVLTKTLEVRFILEEETHCYVRIEMAGVRVWFHRAFPPTLTLMQIMELTKDEANHPVTWDTGTP